MTKRILIADVDKVTRPGKSSGSGKTFKPTPGGTPANDDLVPQPNIPEPKETPKKPKPGRRTLSDDERLDSELIERLEQQLKNDDWNIGGLPKRPGENEGYPGWDDDDDHDTKIGKIVDPEQIPGGDTRIWVDIDQLSKEIDEANRQGEENARVQDAKDSEKAQRTDAQKTIGGGGTGRGRVRDRIAVERLSQIDWAAIFKTRLTAYSKENEKYLPWNRRFVSTSKILRHKIGSNIPQKDVLPELNLLVDTSSSLSFREMAVILGEIEKAMESAKIKTLNVFLWHDKPYEYKSFNDITSKNIKTVIDWINNNWQEGGNNEIALYEEIVKKGKAKKFTISLTDAYLRNHMEDGKLKTAWTKALDPANTIFAIIYPNRAISYDDWLNLGNRLPAQKVPVFFDTKKFS